MSTSTPEFLAWTLARPCELRQIDDWEDPERTERQLRSVREFGEAVRDGRRQGDLCLLEPSNLQGPAFNVSEALRIFGSEENVRAACRDCPANVLARIQTGSLAGCYGELALAQPASELYRRVEKAIDERQRAYDIARLCPGTQPRWFGLWMSPLDGDRSALIAQIIADLGQTTSDWQALILALEVAARGEFPLHARLYPRGEIRGKEWRLAPYCVHCRAEVTDFRRCPTCGREKLPMPPLTRHARGTRPYRPQADLKP